jgi:hypothetical protein
LKDNKIESDTDKNNVVSYVNKKIIEGTKWSVEIIKISVEGHLCLGMFAFDKLK